MKVLQHFYFSYFNPTLDGCQQGTLEPNPTRSVPANPREGSTYYILPTVKSYISKYLWNSTEVEDALVAQAG